MKLYVYILCAICLMSCGFENNVAKPRVVVKNNINANDGIPKTNDAIFKEQDTLIYEKEEMKRKYPCPELMSVVRNSNWRYDRRRNLYLVNTTVATFHSKIVLVNLKCKEISVTNVIDIFGEPTKSKSTYQNSNRLYIQYHVAMDSLSESTYDPSVSGIDITYTNNNEGVIIELVTHDIE